MQAVLRGISKGQIKKIHTLKNALGLSDREYRLTLLENFTVRTSKDMSYEQAEALIARFEDEALKSGVWTKHEGEAAFEDLGQRQGMASPAQLRKIEALWKTAMGIRDAKARRRGLRTWLDRHFGVSDLRFLSSRKVSKVLHALKEMEARKEVKAGGSDESL